MTTVKHGDQTRRGLFDRGGHSVLFAFVAYGVPGMLAGCLMAVGATGVGWLPLDSVLHDIGAVETLRNATSGMILSRLMIIAGVAVMLQTWLVLGFDLLSGTPVRIRGQAAVLAAWMAPLLLAPPLFSRDVYAYLAQGRLLEGDYDPWGDGVSSLPSWFIEGVDPMWGETPSPYGPLFLLMAAWVSQLVGDQAYLAALIFRMMAVVGVAMMLIYTPRLAAAHGIDSGKALWLGVLNPLVILHFVAGGHNDALMMGFILMAFAAALRGRIAWAATLIALSASVKPIGLLALPFIGIQRTPIGWTWARRIGDWVYVTLIAGAVFMVTILIVVVATPLDLSTVTFGWVTALSTPGEVKTWLSPVTALGMIIGGVLQLLGLADTNEGAVSVVRFIGTVTSLITVTWLCLNPQGRSATRGAALAFLAVVVLGPVVHPWYVLWVIPLFAITGLASWYLRGTMLIIAGLSLYAMVESSATADALLDISNGVALLLSIGALLLVLRMSPRERSLLLGPAGDLGLLPKGRAATEASRRWIIGPRVDDREKQPEPT